MRRKSRREYGIAVGGRRTKKDRKGERMVEAVLSKGAGVITETREKGSIGYLDGRMAISTTDICSTFE